MTKHNTLLLSVTVAFSLSLSLPVYVYADASMDPMKEVRQCTIEPRRTKDGKILRRKDVLVAFRKIHPCPVTGLSSGSCPDWYIDHIWPLANGGCDAVYNLQWLPGQIKSCAGEFCKDRWELRVYKPPAASN